MRNHVAPPRYRPGAIAGLVVAACVHFGCYRPNVLDGGFECNAMGKVCPDDFGCDLLTNRCVRTPGSDSGLEVINPADGGGGDGGGDGDDVDAACFVPRTACTPQPSVVCDTFCQTGCGCHQKCSANSVGVVACVEPFAGTLRRVGESCNISSVGTAQQTDNCEQGAVCVTDGCGGSRCYRFCRVEADCPGATCSRGASASVRFCDVPFAACDPQSGATTTGCAAANQFCYLSETMADRTLCDCPFGNQQENGACTLSRECLPGLACVDPLNTGTRACRRVCSLTAGNGGGCPSGGTCRSFVNSVTYGYCN